MSERVVVPGPRDVRAVLDGGGEACVVACPPHPQLGGSRSDRRLRRVGEELAARDLACLRFDYGAWDEGEGERRDAERALAWARDRFDAVGLFGYSFGASVGLRAAAAAEPQPVAVSVLGPDAQLAGVLEGSDADADPLARLAGAVQVCYGERDDTVDWAPVVERARALGHAVVGIPGDHHFVGQTDRVAETVVGFLAPALDRQRR